MLSKPQNQSYQLIVIKRKNDKFEDDNYGGENQKDKKNGIIQLEYRLGTLDQVVNGGIRLFCRTFVMTNKDKCKMIISDKEYEIKEWFTTEEIKGIKAKDKKL